MKSIELLAVGIRLVGIYAFIVGLNTVASQYHLSRQLYDNLSEDVSLFVYVSIGAASLIFIFSFLLLFSPIKVAKWLLPKASRDGVLLGGSAKDIQTALFCVLGVYTLSWAIPELIRNGFWWWYISDSGLIGPSGKNRYIVDGLVNLFEVGVGFYLCLQANGLSHLLWRLREAGSK